MASKRAQYVQIFKKFDDNNDGKLSPTELQQGVRSIGGDLTLEEAKAVIDWSDLDGDKLMDLNEFVKFVNVEEENERLMVLKEAFDMYKVDGDEEWINAKSLKRMLERLGVMKSLKECGFMIDKFDRNGDGVVDFDEFKCMMS